VQKRFLSIAIIATLSISYFISACTKLDTTDIGSDLLPAVDNVHTFDTLLTVNTTQGIFSPDSTIIGSSDDHVLGRISNDPLFGTTQGSVYAQFKPVFYPFYYGNANDTINNSLAPGTGFDSVVLCFSYKGFWGDSTVPLQVEVREVPQSAGGLWDSIYTSRNITFAPQVSGTVIGSTTVDIRRLGDVFYYANKKDSASNQIRIKLSSAFANFLYTRDSLPNGNGAFRSDSLFKTFQKGLAITVTSGNALVYTNLSDSASKLEIHYRRKNAGVLDTAYTAFRINTNFAPGTSTPSATCNNIIRNRNGYPVLAPSANEIYIQSQPGTYANLSIPALATINNRIIHRAELIVEQIPDLTSTTLTPPSILYMDLKDTGTTDKWKPVYLDLNPSVNYFPDNATLFFPSAGVDYTYHGGYARNENDPFGNTIKFYNINITRYIQQTITNHTPNYQFRLYAPFEVQYPQYVSSFENGKRSGGNKLAYGRIKVGSGSNPNYKMRLRLVYSKI
jgi:hypothetical protein